MEKKIQICLMMKIVKMVQRFKVIISHKKRKRKMMKKKVMNAVLMMKVVNCTVMILKIKYVNTKSKQLKLLLKKGNLGKKRVVSVNQMILWAKRLNSKNL